MSNALHTIALSLDHSATPSLSVARCRACGWRHTVEWLPGSLGQSPEIQARRDAANRAQDEAIKAHWEEVGHV